MLESSSERDRASHHPGDQVEVGMKAPEFHSSRSTGQPLGEKKKIIYLAGTQDT